MTKSLVCGSLLTLLAGAPAASQAASQSKQSVEVATQRYRVQKGDTLASIAMTIGFSPAEIVAINPGMDLKKLLAGTIIRVPDPEPLSSKVRLALQNARESIERVERAELPSDAHTALNEAEKALMRARSAFWKMQRERETPVRVLKRKRIWVAFENANLRNAIEAMASAGSIKVVVAPEVKGQVTARFRGFSAFDTIANLARSAGYEAVLDDQLVIHVKPRKREADRK